MAGKGPEMPKACHREAAVDVPLSVALTFGELVAQRP
jgi:hypothetical protein